MPALADLASTVKLRPNGNKKLEMTPNSRSTMELSQKKRKEKDIEWHVQEQLQKARAQLAQLQKAKIDESKEEEMKQTAHLIVVANRLPVTPRRNRETGEWVFDRSSGGLVSAFLGVKNIAITWVGWIGVNIPVNEREAVTKRLRRQQPFSCVPVYLDPQVGDLFYNGFCNNVLWPLLHYIPLSMLDSQASVAELQWQAYQDANQEFADVVLGLDLQEADLVWVQARRGDGLRDGRDRRRTTTRPSQTVTVTYAGLPPDAAAAHAARAAARGADRLVPAHALRHVGDVPHAAPPRRDTAGRPRRRPRRLVTTRTPTHTNHT